MTQDVGSTSLDLTGRVFGLLTAPENVKGRAAWKCRRECGNEVAVRTCDLTTGTTKSCGCLRNRSAGADMGMPASMHTAGAERCRKA